MSELYPDGIVRIGILEDIRYTRIGLEAILKDVPEFQIACSTHDAGEFLEAATELRLDVALIDLRLQGSFELGLNTLETLKQCCPQTKCIIITAFASGPIFLRVLTLDAEAFICKDSSPESNPDIVELVYKVMRGQSYFDPVAVRMLRPTSNKDTAADSYAGNVFGKMENPLTERETEILRVAAEGLTIAQIAVRFTLAESTVKSHLRSCYAKLGVKTRAEALLLAKLNGWLD